MQYDPANRTAMHIDLLNIKARDRGSWGVGISALGLLILPFIMPLIGLFLGMDARRLLKEVVELGGQPAPRSVKAARDAIIAGLLVLLLDIGLFAILMLYILRQS